MINSNLTFRWTNLLVIGLILNIAISTSNAETPSQQFESANKSYRSGNYSLAAKQYESLIKSGQHNAVIYFNNGNCYYKLQDLPNAILNFERAKRLDPLDDDINYNLKIAYANTLDKIEPIPLLFYERWWNALLFSFNPATWSWIAIIAIWISFCFGIWYLFAGTVKSKKRSFLSSSGILIVALMIFGLAACSHKKIYGQRTAIVMDANAYIKSSPDNKSTNLFMLHGGTKIDVLDEIPGYKQIRIANGNLGWIEEKSVVVI